MEPVIQFPPVVESPQASPASVPHSIDEVLQEWGASLSQRDSGTHAHALRVIAYAHALGRVLGLSEVELTTLERGVFLHDVGKIVIPDEILLKPCQLTRPERAVMRRHPVIGHEMVVSIPRLGEAASIVLAHHEWYDGRGYPFGLQGQEIPLGARICAVVDTLDALTSVRPYRRPVAFETACAYILSQRGTHFDPVVIEAFNAIPCWEWTLIRRGSIHGSGRNH